MASDPGTWPLGAATSAIAGVDERHWMPGQGVMDWPATVAALAGVGYAGPFLFEVRACAPEEIAEAWRRLLAA